MNDKYIWILWNGSPRSEGVRFIKNGWCEVFKPGSYIVDVALVKNVATVGYPGDFNEIIVLPYNIFLEYYLNVSEEEKEIFTRKMRYKNSNLRQLIKLQMALEN